MDRQSITTQILNIMVSDICTMNDVDQDGFEIWYSNNPVGFYIKLNIGEAFVPLNGFILNGLNIHGTVGDLVARIEEKIIELKRNHLILKLANIK